MNTKKRKGLVLEAKRLDKLIGAILSQINMHRDALTFFEAQPPTDTIQLHLEKEQDMIRFLSGQCQVLEGRRAIIALLLDIGDN